MKSLLRLVYWKKIIVTLLVASLFSCSNNSSKTIRIGILDGPSAVSFIQLIDKPLVIEGKKIEIIIKSEPMQLQALMMQDKLDFAILPTVMAANLYNKGVKYRMVACPIWGTLYLLKNEKTHSIYDIKGKTVSVFGQGGTSDILLQRIIQQKEIVNAKIDYSYSTNHEIAQALLFKKIKLAVVSEPIVSMLLARDSSIHIVAKLDCEEYIDNSDKDIFVQTSFLVSERFTIENSSLVEKVCKAYSNSCNFTNEQPEEAAKLLVKHNFLPNIDIAKRSIPLCNIRYVGAFAIQQEVNRYLNIFYKCNPKSIGGKLPDSEFIYQTY